MSPSRIPTLAPSKNSDKAKFTAVVDLPTPPLPEATAMIFFTPEISCVPLPVEWLAIFTSITILIFFDATTFG
jgi:hypothetical protein